MSDTRKYIRCKVCRTVFEVTAAKRYTAHEAQGISAAMNGCISHDAFDCPQCGCQNAVGIRYPRDEGEASDAN